MYSKSINPIIILGGGPAGYSVALELRKLLAEQHIIVIEKSKVGGTCLHRGCIPSKQLHAIKSLEDFPRLLRKNQTLLQKGIEAELKAANIELIEGEASCDLSDPTNPKVLITKSTAIAISGETESQDPKQNPSQGCAEISISASRLILATGSRPRRLDSSLLPKVSVVHDTDSFFSEENLSKGFAPAYTLIGGGYIGIELASILASHGIKVRIIEAQDQILGFLDSFIRDKLLEELRRQKIQIHTGVKDLKSLELAPDEQLIVAVGREAVYPEGFSLDGFRTEHTSQQTQKIYLLGDISAKMPLAHYAYAEAKIVARQIAGQNKTEHLKLHLVPQVIFSKPEVAMIGYTEEQAQALYGSIETLIIPWTSNGKARIEGKERGYNKIIIKPDSGEILGVHMIGAGASDLISIAVPILNSRTTVEELRSWIFPHPTLGELFAL